METIWKNEYSLAELVAPDQFKSYEDLKKRLNYVLGLTVAPKRQDPEVAEEETTRGELEDLSEGKVVQLLTQHHPLSIQMRMKKMHLAILQN